MKTEKYQFITGWNSEGKFAQIERKGYLLCIFETDKGGYHLQWVRKDKVFPS